ncbi:putative major facilitator superfamily transporter [Tothia fuscella]|uniref:Major facilitator superfamily transporter n=1 Tax=Tothia fuscella TaxID=1048955 RepID=A0A9P4TWB0_9PEZI|nr:putative major facilitator superfamily transporter [Tothia fuscella]
MTMSEKYDGRHLEQINTRQSESPTGEDLKQVQTLAEVDIENKHAFKGDDSDGKIDWNFRKLLACAFLSMLYTGSQVLLYFVGGSLSFIVKDIGGTVGTGWLPTANTLAIAAVAPFVGYLQDLFGKRYIALFGAMLLCVGCILLGTAQNFGQGVAGMAISGAGAGIGELTGLAGLAEIVPVKYRGYSLAALTAFVFPFTPYVLYSQLLSTYSTWRWGPWISLIYNGITAVGLAVTYFPHAHVRAAGFSNREILKRIDFIGAALSIIGLTLFLVALQAGGYTHPWTSAYVLCTLLIGFLCIVGWILWEWKGAKHPMIPLGLFQGQRVVALAYAVAFVAGMNFFSVLNFWPLMISEVWEADPVQVGLRGLAPGLSVTIGAIFFNSMLSTWQGGAKYILFIAAGILCCFGGAMAVVTPNNEMTVIALGTVSGLGLGGLIVPSATVAMIAAPDALITTCAALSLSVRAVGGSIGYSIYYNIFVNKLTPRLPALVAEYAIKAGLPLTSAEAFVGAYLTAPEKLALVPGVTPAIIAGAHKGLQWAYAEALKYVWYTSIGFGTLAMVCALCIPNTKRFQTNRVAVAL